MSALTLVSEDSGSLAELQRVQRILPLRCYYMKGCRIIKESSKDVFNLHELHSPLIPYLLLKYCIGWHLSVMKAED